MYQRKKNKKHSVTKAIGNICQEILKVVSMSFLEQPYWVTDHVNIYNG